MERYSTFLREKEKLIQSFFDEKPLNFVEKILLNFGLTSKEKLLNKRLCYGCNRNRYEIELAKLFKDFNHFTHEQDVKADDVILDFDHSNLYYHFGSKRTDVHYLKEIVENVNRLYFDGYFTKENMPRISWWWRGAKFCSQSVIAGLAFCNHNEILINIRFKSKNSSKEIVELLVYHEMLHIYLYQIGKPFGHNRNFYNLESKFKNYLRVNKQLNAYMLNISGTPLGTLKFKSPKRMFTYKRFKVFKENV